MIDRRGKGVSSPSSGISKRQRRSNAVRGPSGTGISKSWLLRGFIATLGVVYVATWVFVTHDTRPGSSESANAGADEHQEVSVAGSRTTIDRALGVAAPSSDIFAPLDSPRHASPPDIRSAAGGALVASFDFVSEFSAPLAPPPKPRPDVRSASAATPSAVSEGIQELAAARAAAAAGDAAAADEWALALFRSLDVDADGALSESELDNWCDARTRVGATRRGALQGSRR